MTSQLTAGQLLKVSGHAVLPADGVITDGSTTVDEKIITGLETVEKFPGSRVYAGSKNGPRNVVMRVTAAGGDTLLSKIETFRAELSKPSAQKPLARFAKKLFARKENTDVLRALADEGIFVKNEDIRKKLRAIDTIAFDKTGIITTGARHIEHVVSFKPFTQQQVLNTAAALESHSTHMTAGAIVSFAQARGAASLQRVEKIKEERGHGVSGELNGKAVLVGAAALLHKKKITLPKETLALKEAGLTVVYVVVEKEVAGYIAVSNPVKKNAKTVMSELKKHYRTALLSGEHEDTAAAIAKQVAMHEVVADVRDTNRDAKIKELQDKNRTVAYVTALHPKNAADITITMGTRCAFLGDVTVLHGNLQAIQTLFEEIRK